MGGRNLMERTINKADAIQSLRPKASFAWDPDTNAISQWKCPDGSSVPSDSEIATEITNLQTAYNAKKYQSDRVVGSATTSGYPMIQDQLDQLYHDMTNGKLGAGATTGSWYVGITSIKTAFPKP